MPGNEDTEGIGCSAIVAIAGGIEVENGKGGEGSICGGGGIGRDRSSCGSIFMAFTTLSPSRVDAHRFRDMSGASSSSDVLDESKPGRPPFMCCAWFASIPVLLGGELWDEVLDPAAVDACGDPLARGELTVWSRSCMLCTICATRRTFLVS